MPYAIYDSKYSYYQNKIAVYTPPDSIYLAYFNNGDIIFSSDYQSSILGEMDLSFKLYIDASNNFSDRLLIFNGSNEDFFAISLIDSSIFVLTSTNFPKYYTSYEFLPSYSQSIIKCEVRKNPYVSNYPIYFKINDVSLNGVSDFATSSSSAGIFRLGNGFVDIQDASARNRLRGASIWDVKITEVSTGNNVYYWKGYPDGDTLSAWEDQMGVLDASSISGTIGKRTIPGFIPS